MIVYGIWHGMSDGIKDTTIGDFLTRDFARAFIIYLFILGPSMLRAASRLGGGRHWMGVEILLDTTRQGTERMDDLKVHYSPH